MANSAVRFKDRERYINDSQLGSLLKELAIHLPDSDENLLSKEWLILACQEWCDDFENMPPGLKDIELDKWLVNEEKEEQFYFFIKNIIDSRREDTLTKEYKKIVEILDVT